MKPNFERLSSSVGRAAVCALCAACLLSGCESVQKKFVRKGKAKSRPSAIFQFEDYSHDMTPLDRYRKHFTLFQYWNDELLDGLSSSGFNPKRVNKASAEALGELRQLRGLMADSAAPAADGFIREREGIDRQLHGGFFATAQVDVLRQQLERQTRDIHRTMFWRDVQERLKPDANAAAAASEPAPAAAAAP